jgi:DNA-binding Lrp family transcriptional regulator
MDNNYKLIELRFDQAQQPVFVEKKMKGYVEFGEYNNYPNYLLNLYKESPKHGGIIRGKESYIYGSGFETDNVCNTKGDTYNDILRKCVKDDEIFRGYYLQVIWNRLGKISDIYHIEFAKVRVNKDLTEFYVKNDWNDIKEKARCYPAFNVNNPVGSQIFYYKEYNPLLELYPLPSYFQGLNMIESDIQVSRHILGNAKQGFVGSKLINLNNGDPINEEHKGEVERGLLKKFTGSEGKRVVIMFNKSRDNAAEILDLGASMLTKEDFTNVNALIQQEIFACHQITSPQLFGIQGTSAFSRNELRDAYEIFNNTYVNNRQQQLEAIFTQLGNLKGDMYEFNIVPVEPLKFEFSETIMAQNLSKDEIRKLMGKEPLENAIKTQAQIISDNINSLSPLVANKVLESMTPDEIRSLAGLVPKSNPDGTISNEVPVQQNDAIKNLTGRQYQNIMRIVRNYGNGKLTKQQASLMLKNGFGLGDMEIDAFLGIDDSPLTDDEVEQFSSDEDERLAQAFSETGDDINEFEILHEKSAYQVNHFAEAKELTSLESKIVDLIQNDKRITEDVIAKVLKQPVEVVGGIVKDLTERKVIAAKEVKIGADVQIERVIAKGIKALEGTELMIRYKYAWRSIVPTNERDTAEHPSRPFCVKMMELSRTKVWSRSQIEQISERLGYSVWDRVGGWWTMPNGMHSVQCRHEWKSLIVKKK